MRNNFGLGFVFEAVDKFSGPAKRVTAATQQMGQTAAEAFGAFSRALSTNQDALSKGANSSERARAKVQDLVQSIERNRQAQAALRADILLSGDADGKKAQALKGLSAATGLLSRDLAKARGELRLIDGSLIDAVKKAGMGATAVNALATALGNLASGAITKGFQAATGSIAASVRGAIDFESAMADVNKVLPEGTALAPLAEGAKALAKEIGIAPTQVAALTASLAQSGIAGDELLATAKDASKLAVAFGLSGEQSGQALAKLRTGLGISRDEVNSLTGSINELSNNLAATAPEIIDAVQRVGSVAKSANISAASTAALATAMIASGANAEVAATGTKNFIRALGAGDAATKRQRAAFKALGLDAVETAKALTMGGEAAEATIQDVVTRIGLLDRHERLPNLIRLFGAESIGPIGPLASNIKLLGTAFDLAGNKAKAASSVEREFEARSKTTAVAIEKLKANLQVLGIELGNRLLPLVQGGIGALNGAIERLRRFGAGLISLGQAIGTYLEGTFGRVRLLYKALVQVFSQGGFSGAVRKELNSAENAGIKRFVINVYALFHRLGVFMEGVADGFMVVWGRIGPAFTKLFSAILGAFQVFATLFAGTDEALVGSSVNTWRWWGETLSTVAGTVIGLLADILGWTVGLIERHPTLTRVVLAGVLAWKALGAAMYFGFGAFHAIRRAIVAVRIAWAALQVLVFTNPITAAFAAVATAALLIYEFWEPISGFFTGLWESVTGAFKVAMDWILEKIKWVGDRIEDFKFAVTVSKEEQLAMEEEAGEQTRDLKRNSALFRDDIDDDPNSIRTGTAPRTDALERARAEAASAPRYTAVEKMKMEVAAGVGNAATAGNAAGAKLAEMLAMQRAQEEAGGVPMSINLMVDGEKLANTVVKKGKASKARGFSRADPLDDDE